MNITIENSFLSPHIATGLVSEYLKSNTTQKSEKLGSSGMFISVETKINVTPSGTGEKFTYAGITAHVSCRKTPAGNYIFTLWNA